MKHPDTKKDDTDFSLVLGGPLYQSYLRCRLAKPPLELLFRRVLFFVFITWVPLLILSWIEGTAYGQVVRVPFFYDLAVQLRFLFALPLLVASEIGMHKQISSIIKQFISRGIITEEVEPNFNKTILSAMKLRDSTWVEVALLLLVFVGGHELWKHGNELQVTTWFAFSSMAGKWYSWISVPIFQFLLFRWWFRIIIWARFLWQVSRLPLKLIPTHPDSSAGLGFLMLSVYAFEPIIIAQGALLSGLIGNKILHEGASLLTFKMEIAVFVAALVCMALAPLCVFFAPLLNAKKTGRREYGILASRYVEEFDQKWLRSDPPSKESFMGTPDIRSLANLSKSINVVENMRLVPFGKEALLYALAIAVLPIVPLVFTMIPIDQLAQHLLGVLF